MTALYMFLAAVCILGPLVALHEWGHYIVARLCGVKVLTYSIGMGPRIFGWKSKKSGIDYRISLLPLGGYVRMLDEREGQVADDEKHLAFNNQHPLKKIAIVLAGPVMNFIIAIGLFFVLFLMPSEQLNTRIGKLQPPAEHSGLMVGDKIVAIDNKPVDDWQGITYALADRMGESGQVAVQVIKNGELTGGVPIDNAVPQTYHLDIKAFMQGDDKNKSPLQAIGVLPWQPTIAPVVGEVVSGGAADLMGLKSGDVIKSMNGTAISTWQDATSIIRSHPEKMIEVQVVRDGNPVSLKLMPQGKKIDGQVVGQIGVMVANGDKIVVPDDYKMTVDRSAYQAMMASLQKTYDLSMMTLKSIGKMISGLVGLENLSGPIAIADVSKQSFEMGWMQVLATAALISLSLGVLNLLPIPVLDGGHLLFYTYELIFGKPLSQDVQMTGFRVGFTLLLCFMLLAIGNDIIRVFG